MNQYGMTKEERQKRKKRPVYPMTRPIGPLDFIRSRELWMAVYFFALLQGTLLLITIGAGERQPDKWIYAAYGLGLFTTIHGLYLAKKRQRFKYRADLVHFGRVIAVVLGIFIVNYTIVLLIQLLNIPIQEQTNQTSINALMTVYFVPVALTVTIVAPIVEELVFREYLPHAGGPSILSFALSSLFFIALHSPGGLMGWILYTSMGIAFTFLRLKGNNLFQAIIGHMLYNALTIALSVLL